MLEGVEGNKTGWPQSKKMSCENEGGIRYWPRGLARLQGVLGPGKLLTILSALRLLIWKFRAWLKEGDPFAWPSLRLAVHALGARNSVDIVY